MASKATGLSPKVLDKLIARETNSAEFGFLGSDYIVVLQLNRPWPRWSKCPAVNVSTFVSEPRDLSVAGLRLAASARGLGQILGSDGG